MRRLFDYDSDIMRFLGKMADLMILNIVIMICCIPVFTIGAALTAAHYTCLRMHRNTEGRILQNFFQAFRENFKQSTVIWLIIMGVAGFSAFDIFIMGQITSSVARVVQVLVMVGVALLMFIFVWVFPLQSKFANTIFRTIKNALILSCAHFFRTIYMIMLVVVPVVLLLVSEKAFLAVFLFGMSLPVYLGAVTYNKVFEKLEEQAEDNSQAEEGLIEETGRETVEA